MKYTNGASEDGACLLSCLPCYYVHPSAGASVSWADECPMGGFLHISECQGQTLRICPGYSRLTNLFFRLSSASPHVVTEVEDNEIEMLAVIVLVRVASLFTSVSTDIKYFKSARLPSRTFPVI